MLVTSFSTLQKAACTSLEQVTAVLKCLKVKQKYNRLSRLRLKYIVIVQVEASIVR